MSGVMSDDTSRLCKHGCGTKLYPVYRADSRLHWTQGDGHEHDAIECVAAARATIERLTKERDAAMMSTVRTDDLIAALRVQVDRIEQEKTDLIAKWAASNEAHRAEIELLRTALATVRGYDCMCGCGAGDDVRALLAKVVT